MVASTEIKDLFFNTVDGSEDTLSVEKIPPCLSTETVDKLEFFAKQLLDKNNSINLTSLKEPDLFWLKNVLDSLSPFLFPGFVDKYFKGDLLDLGTGGGFPLIPLAIVFQTDIRYSTTPYLQSFTGMDSVNKKLLAVKEVAELVGVRQLHFLHGRAEDLGRSVHRERFSVVVSRAVAPLNVLLELISPFLLVGGHSVLYKGPGFLDELQEASAILKRLSLEHIETRRYILPDGQGERALLVFRKACSLDMKYPRGANVLRKLPLR